MSRLIATELFKLRRRGMTWILMWVLIGIMVVLHLLLFAISRLTIPGGGGEGQGVLRDLLGLRFALPFAFSLLTSFGAVLAVILMASTVGNEYSWRTLRLSLISSEGRLKFLAAKLISVALLVLVGMVIGVVVSIIMSLITTAIGGAGFDFSFLTGSYVWNQFLAFWRTYFVILPYMTLAFLFAVLGRSALPGIAMGIGVGFLEPIITSFMSLAGGWVGKIPAYLFNANVSAINRLNNLPSGFGGGGPFGQLAGAPSALHAFIVLGIYTVVFIGLAFYLFHKRDVTG